MTCHWRCKKEGRGGGGGEGGDERDGDCFPPVI